MGDNSIEISSSTRFQEAIGSSTVKDPIGTELDRMIEELLNLGSQLGDNSIEMSSSTRFQDAIGSSTVTRTSDHNLIGSKLDRMTEELLTFGSNWEITR